MSIYGVSGSSSGSMADALAQLRNAREQKDTDEFAASFISGHDTDQNGLLSVEETDFSKEQFNTIDADGDGYLSADELTAEERRRQEKGAFNMGMRVPPTADEIASSLISQLDADGDGSLSQEELDMDSDQFSSIDSDGDGILSSEEITEDLQARMDEMHQAAMQMGASSSATTESTNGDASEVAAATAPGTSETSASGTQASSSSTEEEEYDDLDLNKDGTVSFDELRQAMMNGTFSGTLDGLSGSGSTGSDSGSFVSGFMRKMADQAYQTQMSHMSGSSDITASAV